MPELGNWAVRHTAKAYKELKMCLCRIEKLPIKEAFEYKKFYEDLEQLIEQCRIMKVRANAIKFMNEMEESMNKKGGE